MKSTYEQLREQGYHHDIELAADSNKHKRLIAQFIVVDDSWSVRWFVFHEDNYPTEHAGLAAACRAYDKI